MKAIINGKRYDTDKAILVGEYSTSYGPGDFKYFSAGLYRTPRSGQWFVAGEGGPMTVFAERDGDGWRGGSKLMTLSRDEALEWAESYLDADEIEKAFGDTIEDA